MDQLEAEVMKGFDWDLDRYKFELAKCYSEVPASSSNKPKYLEMIGKVKRFFEESSINTYVFASMDKETILSRIKAISDKVINHNQLGQTVSSPTLQHNRYYRTLTGEDKAVEKTDIQTEGKGSSQYQGLGNGVGLNSYTTPPPDISNNSPLEPLPPSPTSEMLIEQPILEPSEDLETQSSIGKLPQNTGKVTLEGIEENTQKVDSEASEVIEQSSNASPNALEPQGESEDGESSQTQGQDKEPSQAQENGVPVVDEGQEVPGGIGAEAPVEPTWSGCKHELRLDGDTWTCAKCGYKHE